MGCGCCAGVAGRLPGLGAFGADSQEKLLEMARKDDYVVSNHPHHLKIHFYNGNWYCNGSELEGGCLSGYSKSNVAKNTIPCYQCAGCDYGYCDKCLCKYLTLQFLQPKLSLFQNCLLYTSPSPRDLSTSRMPSSA
eukprot:TRINITY_DN403_c0_g1_i1.p2 TRINITY_DN403_c0_g1~~TRINITY_DN403_c0_g1_i1.p2  ORF type:complete len:136 (-),score=41.84 TRINITY_DN403_c0_g1_i1:18-425(-)